MQGMDAATGKALSGRDHLYQSVRDILTTPIGSRVQRREYGSSLYELLDRPMNGQAIMEVFAAVAEALDKWEPRFKLTQVKVIAAAPGRMELELTGEYRPDGKPITLEGIVVT
jgi:phage baseplate assembly protein W